MTSGSESEVMAIKSNTAWDCEMTEREARQGGRERGSFGIRSSLLKPITEAKPLERDDIAGFLAGRLSFVDQDEPQPKRPIHLS